MSDFALFIYFRLNTDSPHIEHVQGVTTLHHAYRAHIFMTHESDEMFCLPLQRGPSEAWHLHRWVRRPGFARARLTPDSTSSLSLSLPSPMPLAPSCPNPTTRLAHACAPPRLRPARPHTAAAVGRSLTVPNSGSGRVGHPPGRRGRSRPARLRVLSRTAGRTATT